MAGLAGPRPRRPPITALQIGCGDSMPRFALPRVVGIAYSVNDQHNTLAKDEGPEARRFVFHPPPYGAGWPELACEAEVIFVYEKEPHEPGAHFCLLLAYDVEKNEVGRKRIEGWDP